MIQNLCSEYFIGEKNQCGYKSLKACLIKEGQWRRVPCTANGSGDHPLNSSLASISFVWCHFIYIYFFFNFFFFSKLGYSQFNSDFLWFPRQWRAEKLFCYLSLGRSEQKAGWVFLLLTNVKSQLEFFAFLGFKQRSAQLLWDGKPLWVGDSCDALPSPAWICTRSPSSF